MDFRQATFHSTVLFENIKSNRALIYPFYGSKFYGPSLEFRTKKMSLSFNGCEFGPHTTFKLDIDLNTSGYSESAFRLAAKQSVNQLNYDLADKYEFLAKKCHRKGLVSWELFYKKNSSLKDRTYYLLTEEGLGFFFKWLWFLFLEKTMGYGTKPFKLIYFSLFCIIAFSFIYLKTGLVVPSSLTNNPNVIQYKFGFNYLPNLLDIYFLKSLFSDLKETLFYSASTFFTASFGAVPIGFWGKFWTSFEMALGIFSFGSFTAVFLRKILR